MSCPKQLALLAWDVGLLSPAARAHIEAHVERCDRCQEALSQQRALVAEGAALSEPAPRDWSECDQATGAEDEAIAWLPDAPAVDAPRVNWARVEAALPWRQAREPASTRRPPSDRAPRSADHPVKWRALFAYREGVLSPEGRAQVERHLAACDACSEAARAMGAYEILRLDARDSQPRLDVAKANDLVAKATRKEDKIVRIRRWSVPFLAAAAAAIFFFWRHAPLPLEEHAAQGEPAERRSDQVDEAAPVERESPGLRVRALVGSILVEGAPMAPGDLVPPGVPIEVPARGELHLVALSHHEEWHQEEGPQGEGREGQEALGTREASGEREALWLVAGGSRFMAAYVQDELTIVLLEGQISAQTSRVDTTIEAGEFTQTSTSAAFTLLFDGRELSTQVEEGRADIFDRGHLVRSLVAPERWSSSPHPPALSMPELCRLPDPPSDDADPMSALQLPASADITHWQIGACRFSSQAQAQLRLTPGEYLLTALRDGEARYTRAITLRPEGSVLTEGDVRQLSAQSQGYLSTEEILSVVRPGQRQLALCYHRLLRREHPDFEGEFSIDLTIERDGAVRGVRVRASRDAPPPLMQCLRDQVQEWQFPPPHGGRARVRIPVNFHQGGR